MSKARIENANGFFGGSALINVNERRPYLNDAGVACIVNAQGKEQEIKANATLRYDEWRDVDQTVIKAATDRLTGVKLLMARGLVHNLGSLGITLSQWQSESDMTSANVSMSGVTAGERDRVAYSTYNVPVPIIHKDWEINLRALEASRRMGESLDVTTAAIAGRKVAEGLEDLLFSTTAVKVDGQSIYGFLNFSPAISVVAGTPWDDLAADGNAVIIEAVSDMLSALRANNYYGPFDIIVPGAYESKLDEDYRAFETRTVRQRIEALSGVNQVTVADRLSGDNVVFVQTTSDVVDLAVAQDVSTIQWSTNGGMTEKFKTMACMVPRLKQDYDGKCGIGVLTFSS